MTLNAVGLNHSLKRKRIGKLIKKEKVDIILQETHLRTKEEKILSHIFQGKFYHTPAQTKTKGMSKSLPWGLTDIKKIKEGF